MMASIVTEKYLTTTVACARPWVYSPVPQRKHENENPSWH
jgi:hypothetical protein